MISYPRIKALVELQTRIKIYHSCWIAEVKRLHGLTLGPSWNRGNGNGAPPCPLPVFKAIEKALKRNGEI